MPTTFRAQVVAAHVAILGDQKTATPTLLRKVTSSRPGSFSELPLAYVGSRDESITHDAGTRTRTFDGLTVELVDAFADATQTEDRLDQLVDYLVDRYDLPGNVQRVPNTIIELTSVADGELAVESGNGQSTFYRRVTLTFARTAIKEGRQ